MDKNIFSESGIEIFPYYSFTETQDESPGKFPFTRGIHERMYRERLWSMRQYAGFSTSEESNKRFQYLLDQGVNGLSVAFDLPTQLGYDPDHPLSEGEVGKVGVSITSLEDMALLFKEIPLDKVSTSMTINATAFILLAFYIALAKRNRFNLKKLSGTIQNDILKEYAARGTYIYPPEPSMRIVTDIFEYCQQTIPSWNIISISGYHIREAGSNAIQELAFTLANAKAYVQAALDRGLDINIFGRRISFFFNAHNDLFEEIAKFRAARSLWANIMKDFGATDSSAMMLRFHAQTAGSTLTAQQPMNNIVRVTIQSLAAVLGGAQSLHANGFDEAISLPSQEAATLALRTQQIIAYESGIPNTTDPIGGSYFIEYLTREIEGKSRQLLDEIERKGGAIEAIRSGFMESQISQSSFQFQKKIESGIQPIVGVNLFRGSSLVSEHTSPSIGESTRFRQIAKLKELKSRRNSREVAKCLNKIQSSAHKKENLMYPVIEAAENNCTIGEIAGCLKEVWGEYR